MLPLATFGLLGLLGVRHGLDPDHVAVIDNITFRAMTDRPRLAKWTGALFALGHSVSVMVIAVLFGLLGRQVTLPAPVTQGLAWAVIALLLWMGIANVRALRASGTYVAHGWRAAFLPRALRHSTHPVITLAIGAVFGLVVDTAAQIAAWGATAAASGGLVAAALIGLAFAAGMVLTDSADSLIVARLMQGDAEQARLYRRRIGWLIAALSFAMAGIAILQQLQAFDLPAPVVAIAGGGMAVAVITALVLGNGRRRFRPD